MHNMNLHPGGSLQRVIDLDPSLPEMPDDKYCDNFKNVMVNLDVPGLSMLKMYPLDNVYAFIHDHNYLSNTLKTASFASVRHRK